tara:strand:- start:198 stop:485 length:288 start_codon:yes stop_codon:yes gene_type:complete
MKKQNRNTILIVLAIILFYYFYNRRNKSRNLVSSVITDRCVGCPKYNNQMPMVARGLAQEFPRELPEQSVAYPISPYNQSFVKNCIRNGCTTIVS